MSTNRELELMAIDIAEAEENTLPELRTKLPFRVQDEKSAAWVVGKIVAERSRLEKAKAQFEEIKRSCEQNEKRYWYFFGYDLEAWTAAQLNGTKNKHVKLPTGNMGFRAGRGSLTITDEKKVIEWAEKNLPDAIKTEKSVLKTPIQDFMKNSGGMLPEGAEWEEGIDKFYVK